MIQVLPRLSDWRVAVLWAQIHVEPMQKRPWRGDCLRERGRLPVAVELHAYFGCLLIRLTRSSSRIA